MSLAVAVTRVAADTGGGTQDITTADLGDLTPQAVWLTMTYATSDGTPADHAGLSIGSATGASNQWACCATAENGVATTDTSRGGIDDGCIFMMQPGSTSTVYGQASFNSWITNGIRINWDTTPNDAYYITAVFFAGTDLTAQAAIFATDATENNTVDVNTVGFEPDIVMFGCFGGNFISGSTGSNDAVLSVGVCANDGSDTQRSWSFGSTHGAAASETAAYFSDNYIGGQILSGALSWQGEIGSFDADGFSCTTRLGGSGGDEIGYLALYFNGAYDSYVGTYDTPTSTGDDSVAGIGFQPQFVLQGLTQLTVTNTLVTTGDAGSIGLSCFDEDDEYCDSMQDEDGADPTDTQSLSDNQSVNFPNDAGSAAHAASFVSFDGGGWTQNFSATEGTAVKWFVIAIEGDAVTTTTTTTTTTSTTSTSTTSTSTSTTSTSTSTSTTSTTTTTSTTSTSTTTTTTTTTSTSTTTLSTTSTTTLPPETPRSYHQSRAISINVFTPTIGSYTVRGIFEGNVGSNVNSYSHTVAAVGGYISATFTIFDRLNRLEDWLFGVGRHVEVYSPSLSRIWEGFVNRVTLNVGSLSVVRGPLMQIANRVSVIYSSVDTDTDPPTIGVRDKTDVANDTDSQSKYGIIEKIISVGGTTETEAEQIRDTWLSENSEPETSQQYNNQSQAVPSVTIECLGYVNWLNLFVYNQTASTGTINVSTQIQNVLAADLNSLFSTDYAGIDTNTLQVNRYVNDDSKGWDYIKALTSRGDASDNRYTFGIYNDRKAIYTVQPTTIAYLQRLTDPKQRVETPTGQEIKPWDVQAARYLQFPDFLIGKTQVANLREDPRNMFIEQASFTSPWGLQMVGGKTGTLGTKLAKLGLGGVG